MNTFLPITAEEAGQRGWKEIDILLITGDAYVDHPSFGTALIGRVLEAEGYRVAILPQPDWRSTKDFLRFGRPRLFVGISAGCLDSMLAIYTAHRTPRRRDEYAPGGMAGLRPPRASVVYANRVRECMPNIPILLGGIEASMRRLSHHDFWSETLRRSILLDARANWIAYGMAEHTVCTIARLLAVGKPPEQIRGVRGTVWATSSAADVPREAVNIPGHEEIAESKGSFSKAFRLWYTEQQKGYRGRPVVQKAGFQHLVQMPPSAPLSPAEMDRIYCLPFTRQFHPSYERRGGVPALHVVFSSITAHRGCAGGCAFCTLAAHQGRIIQSRTTDSIREEAGRIVRTDGFHGTITDVGGPTANMYGASCGNPEGECLRTSCLFPDICPHFSCDGSHHLDALNAAAGVPGVRHVFVGTGVRHDLALRQGTAYLLPLCRRHVGGHLKTAPEHVSDGVLARMRKSRHTTFESFRGVFKTAAGKSGKELHLVPYFMSGHPGCDHADGERLSAYIARLGHFTEQVQDFIPLPMTLSGCIYWTGRDPLAGDEVFVPRGKDKSIQRALLQPQDPRNRVRIRRSRGSFSRRPGNRPGGKGSKVG